MCAKDFERRKTMKKILFVCLLVVAVAFVLVGCGRNDMMQETPNKNTATPKRTESPRPTETQHPTQTVENIEPTDPSIKDDITDTIESIVPDMESMLPSTTTSPTAKRTSASQYTDAEIRDNIRNQAWNDGYTVYDIKNEHRAMTENAKAVDVEKSLENIREWDDMSSTRFVFKGRRIESVDGLEQVAEYQTPLLSKSEEAIHNMQLANKTLNGICLLPGEEFSFVFFLGEVSKEKGYKEASVFITTEDGEIKTEKGIGGGVCQVASTLHAACQELGLTIVERHAHSKPVSYIAEGKDAAIARGYKDFKFVNTQVYTIVLRFYIAEKTEFVEIYKL